MGLRLHETVSERGPGAPVVETSSLWRIEPDERSMEAKARGEEPVPVEIGRHVDGRWFVRHGPILVLYPTRDAALRGAHDLARNVGATILSDDRGAAA
jgi:hypothetical protein